jgi:hypothetical protein
MNEATEYLLSGGYCFSIRHSGPFVVGEDFEAPGPAARVLPNLQTDRQTWDKLWAHIPEENTAGSDELSDHLWAKMNADTDRTIRQIELELEKAQRWERAQRSEAPAVRREAEEDWGK